jgi:F-type H+-transporting ATPase subunit b
LRYSIPHLRFSARISCFSVLTLLAAVLLVAPFRAAAQQPAPAAQSSSASSPAAGQAASSEAASSDKAKAEQDESDKYRHAPLVQTMARMLHLDVETTARLFEFINFAIIFLAVVIPLGRIVPKVIRKRSQTLMHSLKTAREVTEDANTRLSAVEARLAGLDEEIAKYRAQVEQESLADEVRIKATIEEESARIVASAEQEIGVAAAQARRGLRNYAAELAVEQASKQLVLSPQTDRALITEFIGDVANRGANKEGQN